MIKDTLIIISLQFSYKDTKKKELSQKNTIKFIYIEKKRYLCNKFTKKCLTPIEPFYDGLECYRSNI